MANPNWVKGVSGNPKGRVANPFIEYLREALIEVEEEKKEKFLKKYVKRAFEKDVVMMDLAKKLVPDLVQQDNINKNFDLTKAKQEIKNDLNSRVEPGSTTPSGD
jgi:hypothetical protein